MTLFDASNRDQCEVERLVTNTPLQALVMLNDPTMLEASRVLAGKLLKEETTPEQNIKKAFRKIVCRFPEDREMEVLINYHRGQLKTMDTENANALLNVGEFPFEENLDPVEWASLMQVISTIYNLEETISKT